MKKGDKEIDPKVRLEFAKYIATHLQTQIVFADRKAAWVFSVLAVGTAAIPCRKNRLDNRRLHKNCIPSIHSSRTNNNRTHPNGQNNLPKTNPRKQTRRFLL